MACKIISTYANEINNVKRQFFETIDMEILDKVIDYLEKSPSIYVIGSRVSYTFAYYLGWSLTKVRSQVHILKGSDSTSIDWLIIAPANSLVVIIATSRYPNELIKLGKLCNLSIDWPVYCCPHRIRSAFYSSATAWEGC